MPADVINDADLDLNEPAPITRVYVPAEIGHEPETAVDALKSAKALLREEGRWAKFVYYDNEQARTPFDDPFCGSWHACAVGALQLVTMGLNYRTGWGCWRPLEDGMTFVTDADRNGPDAKRVAIYEEALLALDKAAAKLGDPVGSAVFYNDRDARTRDEVLYMYDVAIGVAAR